MKFKSFFFQNENKLCITLAKSFMHNGIKRPYIFINVKEFKKKCRNEFAFEFTFYIQFDLNLYLIEWKVQAEMFH